MPLVARRITPADAVREYPILYLEMDGDRLPDGYQALALPEFKDIRHLCSEVPYLDVKLSIDGWSDPLIGKLRYKPAECLERIPKDIAPCQLMSVCNLYNPSCHQLRDLKCPVYEPTPRPSKAQNMDIVNVIDAWREGFYIVLAKV